MLHFIIQPNKNDGLVLTQGVGDDEGERSQGTFHQGVIDTNLIARLWKRNCLAHGGPEEDTKASWRFHPRIVPIWAASNDTSSRLRNTFAPKPIFWHRYLGCASIHSGRFLRTSPPTRENERGLG